MIPYRSECQCPCHDNPGVLHCIPCCRSDVDEDEELRKSVEAAAAALLHNEDYGFPVMPESIFKTLGFKVVGDLNSDKTGLVTGHVDSFCIHYNPNDSLNRKRFSLAHSLGHLVFRDRFHMDRVDSYSLNAHGSDRVANYFAGCLLLPEDWLVSLLKKGVSSLDELSKITQTSEVLIETRLRELDIIV